jgi:hypothetical protein
MFSNAGYLFSRVHGEGRYELKYAVVADNFPTARGSFLLSLDRSLDSTTLTRANGLVADSLSP